CQLHSGLFFSSRRRHTRWPRDWSSDVCSSDLWKDEEFTRSVSYSTVGLSKQYDGHGHRARFISHDGTAEAVMLEYDNKIESLKRSEERRVGKESKSKGSP